MARQAVQLPLQLPGISRQLFPTVGAAEVIRMIGVIPEHQRLLINYQVAFLANILAQALGFLTIMARPAEVPASILHKAQISKSHITDLTTKAFWVPVVVHCLDNTANDELTTFPTAGCKEHLEVMFAILSSFKLIKKSIWKLTEALSTDKAVFMIQLPVAVHNSFRGIKARATALTNSVCKGI